MSAKENNLKIVDQIMVLLRKIEIEGNGHDQGFVFLWGQEFGEKTAVLSLSAGCPSCTITHILATVMEADLDLQQSVLQSIGRLAKQQANKTFKPGKEQQN